MQIDTIEFDHVTYNPERAGFEALVSVRDKGEAFCYPVHVAAPLHAEYALVTRRLAQAAEKSHRAKQPGMRAVRPSDVPSYQARVAQILAENELFLAETAQWDAQENRQLAA